MPQKELLEQIRPLTAAKKKAVREAAEQLALAYEGGGGDAGEDADGMNLLAFCTRHLPKSAKSALRWAFPDEIPPVRWRDSEEQADPTVVLCYLSLILSSKSMELNPSVRKIKEGLKESDLHAIAEDATAIDRFGGKTLLGITLLGKLQKSGWYKGSVQDGGCFYTFYQDIAGVGVQLYFSGMYVSPGTDEKITVGQVCFYRSGSVERGSYIYDNVKKDNLIPLSQIPPRLFSEIAYSLTLATASSTEEDGNWKKDANLLMPQGK